MVTVAERPVAQAAGDPLPNPASNASNARIARSARLASAGGPDKGEGKNGNDWQLPRFEGHSATESVRRMIREAIVDGRIPPGEQLREARLVQMLGISRGTVREAIRQLVQEGLVEYRMHHGAFVKSQLLDERFDVYVAREAIEVWAAKVLLEGDGRIDLSQLKEALTVMRSREARQKRPTEETIAADLRFHHELVRLAGSERLTRAHETFAAETRMLLRRHPPYPWRTYAEDHEKLIDAIQRKDQKTPEMVAEHLRLSVRLLKGEEEAPNPTLAPKRGRDVP